MKENNRRANALPRHARLDLVKRSGERASMVRTEGVSQTTGGSAPVGPLGDYNNNSTGANPFFGSGDGMADWGGIEDRSMEIPRSGARPGARGGGVELYNGDEVGDVRVRTERYNDEEADGIIMIKED